MNKMTNLYKLLSFIRSQESSSDLTALWIILAIVLPVLIYILCVAYYVKRKNIPWRQGRV